MKAGEVESFKLEAKTRHRKTLNRFFLERHEKNPHNESTNSPCVAAVHQAKRAMRLDWSEKMKLT